MELPSLETSSQNSKTIIPENKEETDITEILTRPGTRLIMPSEETQINLGEEPRTKIFDSFRVRGGGGRKKSANPHQQGGVTFAKVFANDLAAAEIDKENPSFPVGSVIVREKLLQATDTTPEVIAVMVKRAKGFSPRTNDWEFFTFGGADLRLQKRETKGDCAKCHTQAGKSDWIFRTYLK